jgi:hypothetical protein
LTPAFQNCSSLKSANGNQNLSAGNGNGNGGGGNGSLGLKTDNGCTVNLPGDCDSPVAAYSVNNRIVSNYPITSPLFTAVRIPDLASTPVLQAGQGTFDGSSGVPDVTQIGAWLASAPKINSYAIVTVLYDQSGNGNDASQGTYAAAPRLHVETGAPAGQNLSLLFGNETANSHANYASDLKNGNNLSIASLTNSNPTTLTFAPLPAPSPSPSPYPPGGVYPLLPTPDYWVLPGALIQDKSLPPAGLQVLTASPTTLVLNGQPVEIKNFSNSVNITPGNVWLDLPSGLNVPMNSHTMLMGVRTGCAGTQYYMTLGQNAEAQSGASQYSAFYNSNSTTTLNLASGGNVNTTLVTATISDDVDVYSVARNGGTVEYNLGENGTSTVTDNVNSTATLSSGSLGYTQQVSVKNEGTFEGYGFLIFGSALSANDASVIGQTMKSYLAIPPVPTTQVIYTGASTVIGHGIDSVENPAKRISVNMAAQGHAVRTYTVSELTQDLLTDLLTGGPVTNLYKSGTGTNILVIHPTVSDSFHQFRSGQLPSQCTQQMSLAKCLWTVTADSITAAQSMGWKVVLLGPEPKIDFFEGTNGTMTDFLAFISMEQTGWQGAGAYGYMDMESNDIFGGSDGKGGMSHCPFWGSTCIAGYRDPNNTQEAWQPDGQHFQQLGYDTSADMISQTLVSLGLY